jgi:hypothetical protein
LGCYSKKRV